MSLEEYMGELKGQIRDKNARILVSDEINAHIEEQADSYQRDGIRLIFRALWNTLFRAWRE